MSLVDKLQLLERVIRMGSAPQSALMADANLARPTEDRQLLLVVRRTEVLVVEIADDGRFIGHYLEILDLDGNLLEPSAVHELVDVQRRPTVRALLWKQTPLNHFHSGRSFSITLRCSTSHRLMHPKQQSLLQKGQR